MEIKEGQVLMPINELVANADMAPATRGFMSNIISTIQAGEPAIIAEIKKASPGKGFIRESFDPIPIAESSMIGG